MGFSLVFKLFFWFWLQKYSVDFSPRSSMASSKVPAQNIDFMLKLFLNITYFMLFVCDITWETLSTPYLHLHNLMSVLLDTFLQKGGAVQKFYRDHSNIIVLKYLLACAYCMPSRIG